MATEDYDYEWDRASVSVIDRLGHEYVALAGEAACSLSKSVRRPVCVIARVQHDNITGEEIDKILTKTKISIGEIVDACSEHKRVN